MLKRLALTGIASLILFNQAFCQVNESELLNYPPISSDELTTEKMSGREIFYPIEMEIERNLGQVMTTGVSGILLLNENDLYVQGQLDASMYYKGYKGAGTGTLITSLISPLVGLIPAIATSSSTPQEFNLGYPDADLLKQREYYDSYIQKSKKIKQRKVWTNWAIGFGVNLVGVLILLN